MFSDEQRIIAAFDDYIHGCDDVRPHRARKKGFIGSVSMLVAVAEKHPITLPTLKLHAV
jgi:hypothetical protein